MNRITAILEADADGTLHLPVPPELRRGKVEVTATLKPVDSALCAPPTAPAEMVERRKAAIRRLRDMGGLRNAIPDPVAWQRELRTDRPLPGRD